MKKLKNVSTKSYISLIFYILIEKSIHKINIK